MLFVDQRQFKKDLHDLIDWVSNRAPERPPEFIDFDQRVLDLALHHGVAMIPSDFTRIVWKLIVVDDVKKAHLIADFFGDRGLTRAGIVAKYSLKVVLKYGALIALVALSAWAIKVCGVV